jgi:hypothetical protein
MAVATTHHHRQLRRDAGDEDTLITLTVGPHTQQGSGEWSFTLPSESTSTRTATVYLVDANGGSLGTSTATVTSGSNVLQTTVGGGSLPVGGGLSVELMP